MADNSPSPSGGAWEQPRPSPWIPLLIGALLLFGAAYYFLAMRPHASAGAAAAVTAQSGRLTYETDDGENLTSVDRQDRKELWYRVVLDHAPIGSTLTLDCDWIEPGATKPARQNHYTTKEIDKSVWPTHARFQLPADAPTGMWTVQLSLEGRILHTLKFEVK